MYAGYLFHGSLIWSTGLKPDEVTDRVVYEHSALAACHGLDTINVDLSQKIEVTI